MPSNAAASRTAAAAGMPCSSARAMSNCARFSQARKPCGRKLLQKTRWRRGHNSLSGLSGNEAPAHEGEVERTQAAHQIISSTTSIMLRRLLHPHEKRKRWKCDMQRRWNSKRMLPPGARIRKEKQMSRRSAMASYRLPPDELGPCAVRILHWLFRYPFQRAEDISVGIHRWHKQASIYRALSLLEAKGLVEVVRSGATQG